MITHNVAMPRWRAMVLCLAGVLAMTKPLATGISLYRETLRAPVSNYTPLYGWVENTGPFNANERWRGQQRLRVIGYPRDTFTDGEIGQAAAEVRSLGLAEVRRHRLEEAQKAQLALPDRAIAVFVAAAGGAGVLFYLWLGCTFLRDPQAIAAVKDPRTTWLGRKKRHGRITFGRLAA
jgi:hypothetical protein